MLREFAAPLKEYVVHENREKRERRTSESTSLFIKYFSEFSAKGKSRSTEIRHWVSFALFAFFAVKKTYGRIHAFMDPQVN